MNWLHLEGIAFGFCALLAFILWLKLKHDKDYSDCWTMFPVFLFGMFQFIIWPIINTWRDTDSQYYTGEIISLENSSSYSGEVSGGMFGFSGGIKSSSTCTMVIKWGEIIKVVTIPTDSITFYESDTPKVQRQDIVDVYPLFIKPVTEYSGTSFYHVFIPTSSIKKYIKFN